MAKVKHCYRALRTYEGSHLLLLLTKDKLALARHYDFWVWNMHSKRRIDICRPAASEPASEACGSEHRVVAADAMGSCFAFCPSGACSVFLYDTDTLQALGCIHPGSSATAMPAGLIWVPQGWLIAADPPSQRPRQRAADRVLHILGARSDLASYEQVQQCSFPLEHMPIVSPTGFILQTS